MAETTLFGRNLFLYGLKNGKLTRACASRTCSLAITTETKVATSPPASVWQSTYAGMISYTLSATGVCKINPDKFTHRDMLQMQFSQTPMLWMMKSTDAHVEFYCGTAVINSFQLDADMSDVELFTLNATGDGEIMIDNPYLIKLLQGSVDMSAIGSMGKLIGYLETGGLPPIDDNC